MCLLFMKVNSKCDKNGYRIIIVNVRDEKFSRPTRKCCWWSDCEDIIGGIDMFPGREGGTWLALNRRTKRIGVLLNIVHYPHLTEEELVTRGCLVSNFLKNDKKGKAYLEEIKKTEKRFRPFTMITVDLAQENSCDEISCLHYDYRDESFSVGPGIHSFGNNGLGKSWKKMVYGKENFKRIVDEYPDYENRDQLTKSLFEMLDDDTKHFPDAQLQSQAESKGDSIAREFSAIHICMKDIDFGSRTKTIILVSGQGDVEITEKTMSEGCNFANPVWEYSKFNFKLNMH